MKSGFYEMADGEYFADPWGAENPSLSASMAKTIMAKSIQNAWSQSPHCPQYVPFKPNAAMEFGKAVHALVFGGENVVIIDAPDYRTKACLLYTSPSPRDQRGSRMPSSA